MCIFKERDTPKKGKYFVCVCLCARPDWESQGRCRRTDGRGGKGLSVCVCVYVRNRDTNKKCLVHMN